ncbi:MAG: Cys-Xaa-Xaa-Xaa repeat radical SAM target protein [Muribaculaceae bacterium]|nr:Cys-Xaa-Xaa-Xaa repeat radical SAM target protein [Muribaculaceae bacterium]
MKSNKNEELKSRRDFFKKAAKSALPILGAVVLASSPIVSKAATAMSCDNTCQISCARDCIGGCHYGCKTSCSDSCSGSCKKSCYYSNK